jgi:hypothetical protein
MPFSASPRTLPPDHRTLETIQAVRAALIHVDEPEPFTPRRIRDEHPQFDGCPEVVAGVQHLRDHLGMCRVVGNRQVVDANGRLEAKLRVLRIISIQSSRVPVTAAQRDPIRLPARSRNSETSLDVRLPPSGERTMSRTTVAIPIRAPLGANAIRRIVFLKVSPPVCVHTPCPVLRPLVVGLESIAPPDRNTPVRFSPETVFMSTARA